MRDCIDYLTFTTGSRHGLSEGDLVSLTSIDERFSGIYVVALVGSEYSFSIPVDAFTGLVFNLGISLQSPNDGVWSAKTENISYLDSTKELIGVSEIVDESAVDPKETLAQAIYLSLDLADTDSSFQIKRLVRNGYDIELSLRPLKADPTLKPSALSGSLATNGNVSAIEWTFPPTMDTVITINNVDDVIKPTTSLPRRLGFNDTKICIWNQDESSSKSTGTKAVSPRGRLQYQSG